MKPSILASLSPLRFSNGSSQSLVVHYVFFFSMLFSVRLSVFLAFFASPAQIWHDNAGMGAAWFLDRVEVHTAADPAHLWVFPCNRWLSKTEDDKLVRASFEKAVFFSFG